MFGFFESKPVEPQVTHSDDMPTLTGWRPFKVMHRQEACANTILLTLMPADDLPLPPFRPGQSVALRLPGLDPRAYTLCSTHEEGFYRLCSKMFEGERGELSSLICRTLHVGEHIDISEPFGGFLLKDAETPVVMIAEGIGITPMVAMLSSIATDHPLRRVHMIYVTKNGDTFPLRDETKQLMHLIPDSGLAVGYTDPRPDDHLGLDYQFTGKLMPATLRTACLDPTADVYLCGSQSFVEDVQSMILQYRTIPADHIHSQIFVRNH